MIGLASKTFSAAGDWLLESIDNNLSIQVRRVNKTRTLDGGVFVTDFGYAAADEDFDLVALCTEEQGQAIRDLAKVQDEFSLTTIHGAYVVHLKRIEIEEGGLRINAVVVSG